MNLLRNSTDWQFFAIDQIKPYPAHARTHNKRQIEKLKKLIRHFGQVVPIVVDRDGIIIDGHAVWTAVRELGSGEIAAVVVANRADPEIKALRLALNRIPRDAAWDDERLREELEELATLSFDLDLTGFDAVEIDHLLEVDVPKLNVADDEDQIPSPQTPAISAAGDIWTCGRHHVGCGDARDQAFIEKVSGGLHGSMCFVDPPYNVPIAGFVSGKGRVQHREFVQGVGELNSDQFTAFLAESLTVLQQSASDRALIYACMDWRHIFELLGAGRQSGLELINLCVWAKTNAGMGSLYRSQHELICVFKAGPANHTNNVELGRHGRNRANLRTYRGLNSFGADRDELLASHPTVKPVLMIADAIRDVTRRGEVVLDTFMGSGSTVMAAEETGRVGVGVDLDPLYVDVAVRRWQARTRRDALHAETGETFDDRAKRLASQSREEQHGQQG
jgi:DNA modification methylase